MLADFLKKQIIMLKQKVTEIEGKIPIISCLTTSSALTAVKNKIPYVGNLVKKQIMMQKYQTLNLNI